MGVSDSILCTADTHHRNDSVGNSFSPPKFVSHCPIKMGIGHWRFQTRQQTWGSTKRVKVSIVGAGGTVYRTDFQVELSPGEFLWAS